MRVSLQSLLELSSNGDQLASEAVAVIIGAVAAGLDAVALMSFSGNAITVKLVAMPSEIVLKK